MRLETYWKPLLDREVPLLPGSLRAAVVAAALLSLSAAPAAAGTFQVHGLGLNSAGCPNGWLAQSSAPERFAQANNCSSWNVRTTAATAGGQWAGANLFTAAGARFTGFSIRSGGQTRNGMYWRVLACRGWFDGCATYAPLSGSWFDTEASLGTLGAGPALDAHHIFAGLWCLADGGCADAPGARAGDVTQRESHAVVEDYTAPGAPGLSGVSTGWNSGQRTLSYSASDAGSGVESVTLTVDGSLHRTNAHSCLRLPAGGYQAPVPCVESTGGQFAVNEPGQLADGRHSLTVTARDAGGESASATQEFLVDNNAPGHPIGLAVEGGDGWRAANDFAVTWQNPDQGAGSAVAGAYYKVGSAPTSATDGTRVPLTDTTSLSGLRVPGDGDWAVYVWLEDAAGNAQPSNVATAHLRLDTTAPTVAFAASRNEHDPAEVRADTSDATSGVAGGRIEIRRRGIADWQPLDTRLEGTQLVATVPDERFERGTYELRATAWDQVGNAAESTRRSDGQEMVVDLPLRGDTSLRANLARRPAGSHGVKPTIRVGYRRAAWLRGVLRSGSGTPLPDTRLSVFVRPMAGGGWRPFTELVTNGHGRYAVRLPRGASRDLMVHFPGTRSLRPASDLVKLRVRGWAALKLRPRRVRRGGRIRFVGRVGLLDAAVPAGGKLVQIQFLDGRRWRPAVKLGRTDARGRFRIAYRFRRISRPTRIHFRILVPAESGWPYVTGASRTRIARVRP